MSESVRLAKRLATEQSCSRGDAERYIEGGWVAAVSYTHLTLPTKA